MEKFQDFLNENSDWLVNKIYIFRKQHKRICPPSDTNELVSCHFSQVLQIEFDSEQHHYQIYLKVDRDEHIKFKIMDGLDFMKQQSGIPFIVFVLKNPVSISDYFTAGEATSDNNYRLSCRTFAMNCLNAQIQHNNLSRFTDVDDKFFGASELHCASIISEIGKELTKKKKYAKKQGRDKQIQPTSKYKHGTIGRILQSAGFL